MKKRFGTYAKTREPLPLEGGGKRVGVKGLTGIAKRFRKHSTDTEQRPSPLPCGVLNPYSTGRDNF
jgi:hypothetical protein